MRVLALVLVVVCWLEARAQLDRQEPPAAPPRADAAPSFGFDPARAPRRMRDDCARQGKRYVAWRGDGQREWSYDCVDARLGLHEADPRGKHGTGTTAAGHR